MSKFSLSLSGVFYLMVLSSGPGLCNLPGFESSEGDNYDKFKVRRFYGISNVKAYTDSIYFA